MNAVCARSFILVAALLAVSAGVQSQSTPTSPQPQSNPPAKAKPKRPPEPIDPDNSAGVRGSGTSHTVRVLRKAKPAEGAHVLVKNTNGSLAASCYTNSSGECQVDIGADSYIIDATGNGRAGTVSLKVDDATGPIVIKLAKVKSESSASKP
jgi:hypothetical protein